MKMPCSICGEEITAIPWIVVVKSKISKKLVLCPTCTENENWVNSSSFGIEKTGPDGDRIKIVEHSRRICTWIQGHIGARCAVLKRDETHFVCRIVRSENNYIFYRMEGAETHEKKLPLCTVAIIEKIRDNDNRFGPDLATPIFGYKGVTLCAGRIMASQNCEYELGVPQKMERLSPFYADYQDTYFHFCMNMENVLEWRDYITQQVSIAKGNDVPNYRLFRVRADGHCFENTPGNWVSNHLTLVAEVTQAEIIDYVETHPTARMAINDDIWAQYKTINVLPY